jgi:long-chain acyl-CoA synthetase
MHPGAHAQDPAKLAVVMADGRSLTYAELEARSNRLAHWFRSIGLRRGDPIAFVLENSPDFFVVAWAAQRSGLSYTPCSTRLKAPELAHIVADCGATVVLASAATVEVAAAAVPDGAHRVLVDGARDGWQSLDDVLRDQPADRIADESEGGYLLYSSGTTGTPKGVRRPLPEEPFPQPASGLADLFEVDETTVYLSPAPLYHAAPIGIAFLVHRAGGCIVVQDRFDAESLLRLVEQHRVTFTQVVPTMFVRLLALPDEVRNRYDLSSLRVVVHGAAPCPIEVKERMIEWLGPIVHEYYSGTEGVGFVYLDSEEWLAHKGSVGRSLLGPLHVVDDDGTELPAGQVGAIFFENVGFEYEGDPEKTASVRDPQGRGWSTLGDIGYLDADGYLYLTDRRAYTIVSGGVNVYPQEAENVLAVHPSVADVAVFGVPDDDLGERAHAVVQLVPGVTPSPEQEALLLAYGRERLSGFKCPRTLEFRAELPRDDTGKLYKRLLRDEHWAGRTLTGG